MGWWPPLAETGNNLTVGEKMPYSLVTKSCLIETASILAGTSERVRLRGQIYASCQCAGFSLLFLFEGECGVLQRCCCSLGPRSHAAPSACSEFLLHMPSHPVVPNQRCLTSITSRREPLSCLARKSARGNTIKSATYRKSPVKNVSLVSHNRRMYMPGAWCRSSWCTNVHRTLWYNVRLTTATAWYTAVRGTYRVPGIRGGNTAALEKLLFRPRQGINLFIQYGVFCPQSVVSHMFQSDVRRISSTRYVLPRYSQSLCYL